MNHLRPIVALVVLSLACSAPKGESITMPNTTPEVGPSLVEGPDRPLKTIAKLLVDEIDRDPGKLANEDPYSIRFVQLAVPHRSEDNLNFNFAVLSDYKIRIVSFADGSARVSRKLLDLFDDNELLFVIGREIGHIKLEYAKRRFQSAFRTAMPGKSMDKIPSQKEVTALAQVYLNTAYTDREQRDADTYALAFLKKHGYKTQASVSALQKLAALETEVEPGATKPKLKERIKILEERINSNYAAQRANKGKKLRSTSKPPQRAPQRIDPRQKLASRKP